MRVINDHDYVQAFDQTYAMTSILGGPWQMMYHRRGEHPGTTNLKGLEDREYSRYSIADLEMAEQPIVVHAVNTQGCDQGNPERKIAFFVHRQLSRNWKRGLFMNSLSMSSPESWHPEDYTGIIKGLVQGEENFMNLEEFYRQAESARNYYGIATGAISPEIILFYHDGYCRHSERSALVYWNNRPVGFLRDETCFLAGEYEYLMPKFNDYFGEVNVR